MTLLTMLHNCELRALRRILKSKKDFIFFEVTIINPGIKPNVIANTTYEVKIICTDVYRRVNYGKWNGYDCINENDELMKEFIKGVIKDKTDKILKGES